MKRRHLLLTLPAVLALGLSCSNEDDDVSAEDVRRESKEAIEAAGKFAEQKQKQAAEELETRLDELKQNWGPMRERAREQGQAALEEFDRRVTELAPKLREADQTIDQLKREGGAAWESLKARLEKTVEDLEREQGAKPKK